MKNATGFTLIELMIVVAVLGILAVAFGSSCRACASAPGYDPEIRQIS